MTAFFTAFLTALLMFWAYFMFYRNNAEKAVLCGLLLFKAGIVWFIAGGAPAQAPAVIFSCCGAAVMAGLAGAAALRAAGMGFIPQKRHYAAVIAAAALLLLLSGCGGRPRALPAVSGELRLKFVPGHTAASEKGGLYISAEREKNVYLYDVKRGKEIKNIPAGFTPGEILVNSGRMYVANEKNASVTVYDPVSDTAESMDSGGLYPGALALNPVKNLLYVANTGSGNVAIIDLHARAVRKRITTGKWPSDLYLSPDYRYLYVSCKYTNTVQLIDAEKERFLFTKIETGISPVQLIPLDKRYMAIINEWEYAFNQQSAVLVFDTGNYGIVSSIRVDGGIFHGVLSKSKKYLYISVPLKDRVIVMDVKKREVVYSIEMKDAAPRWLSLSKDGREIYASASNAKKIITISLNDLF